jgi:eukaryotic-like serine/threonine-protein kinase
MDAAREAEALAALERARKARETLVKADPSVIRDQTQLITIYRRIAEIQIRAGRVAEAWASCQSALANASRLADAHPGNVALQSQVAAVYNDVADFHGATGKPSEALPFLDKAEAIQRKLAGAESSQQRYRTILSDGLRRRGITLKKCGRSAGAVAAFREAIAVLEGLASPGSTEIYDIACNQSLLSALARESGSGLSDADGRAEADKAMASLRRAVAAGWGQAAHMRVDTDLDPLRSRPDFGLLLLDLAFPNDPFAPGR